MNKLSKATIAAAAGVALLLGGGGTLAYWNATADLGGATQITAGNLAVATGTTSAWTLNRGSAAAVTVDPKTMKVVPGDKLTYTTTFTVTGEGRNLTMAASLAPGSITAASSGNKTANDALAAYLTTAANKGATIAIGAAAPAPLVDGKSYDLPATLKDGVQQTVVTVTYSLQFPYSDTAAGAENAAMNGVVDLSKFTVNVRQTANGA